MKFEKIKSIESPYADLSDEDYRVEKRRLQVELLKIQELIRTGSRLCVVFEGRDASGKGSTIKRFIENLIPANARVVALGIPTAKESKNWFRRYQKHFPKPGEAVFFDRSWYTRALIEPTMGYCTETQYKYFMSKVIDWEQKYISEGLLLVKFYLSISKETQLYRFEDRLNNPLTYWKFSNNDLKARKKWQLFTRYKEQMVSHTSSKKSPWVLVSANNKKDARLTCMLHLIRLFRNRNFTPLTGEDVIKTHSVIVGGVKFRGLSLQQMAVLNELKGQENFFVNLDDD